MLIIRTKMPDYSVPDYTFKALPIHGVMYNFFIIFPSVQNNALERVHKLATKTIQKRYGWGINWGAHLPQGFIFLKKKKQFQKGRTIISYEGSTFALLLKFAATALEAMLTQVWPQSLGPRAMVNSRDLESDAQIQKDSRRCLPPYG